MKSRKDLIDELDQHASEWARARKREEGSRRQLDSHHRSPVPPVSVTLLTHLFFRFGPVCTDAGVFLLPSHTLPFTPGTGQSGELQCVAMSPAGYFETVHPSDFIGSIRRQIHNASNPQVRIYAEWLAIADGN